MTTTAAGELDAMMEAASQALARMDYLVCESHCLDAMAIARQRQDWPYYARILMPLQEARRQRRMIAAEAGVRLGTASLEGDPSAWLEHMRVANTQGDAAGCIVLTQPHNADDAHRLAQAVASSGRCIEILLADSPVTASQWTLRAYADDGPDVDCTIPAPPAGWRDRWLGPEDGRQAAVDASAATTEDVSRSAYRPVDWFLDGAEALGDAAIAQVQTPLGQSERVVILERCLKVVTDHEKLHQALEKAARAVSRQATARPEISG